VAEKCLVSAMLIVSVEPGVVRYAETSHYVLLLPADVR
jgi:hypothetical protein